MDIPLNRAFGRDWIDEKIFFGTVERSCPAVLLVPSFCAWMRRSFLFQAGPVMSAAWWTAASRQAISADGTYQNSIGQFRSLVSPRWTIDLYAVRTYFSGSMAIQVEDILAARNRKMYNKQIANVYLVNLLRRIRLTRRKWRRRRKRATDVKEKL